MARSSTRSQVNLRFVGGRTPAVRGAEGTRRSATLRCSQPPSVLLALPPTYSSPRVHTGCYTWSPRPGGAEREAGLAVQQPHGGESAGVRLAAALVGIVGTALPAGAAPLTKAPAPTVSDFTVTPATLYDVGGPVTLSADITNATSCTFSSTPAIPGFPAKVACTSGTVTDSVVVPPDTGKKDVNVQTQPRGDRIQEGEGDAGHGDGRAPRPRRTCPASDRSSPADRATVRSSSPARGLLGLQHRRRAGERVGRRTRRQQRVQHASGGGRVVRRVAGDEWRPQ